MMTTIRRLCNWRGPALAKHSARVFLLALLLLINGATAGRVAVAETARGRPVDVWTILRRVGDKYAGPKYYRFSGTDGMMITLDKSTYRHTNQVEIVSGGTPQSTGCRFAGRNPIEKIAGAEFPRW